MAGLSLPGQEPKHQHHDYHEETPHDDCPDERLPSCWCREQTVELVLISQDERRILLLNAISKKLIEIMTKTLEPNLYLS